MKNIFLNTIQLEKRSLELGSPLETVVRNSNNYLREDSRIDNYLFLGVDQIDFISNDDDRHRPLRVENLRPQRLHLEERVGVVDVVHEDKRVRRLDGQIPHRGELVRARCIQNVEGQLYTGNVEIPVMHLLHRPLVLGGERVVEELIDYRRFPHFRRPHHDDLVPYRTFRVFPAAAVRLRQPLVPEIYFDKFRGIFRLFQKENSIRISSLDINVTNVRDIRNICFIFDHIREERFMREILLFIQS